MAYNKSLNLAAQPVTLGFFVFKIMQFLEKDLEDIIFETSNERLREKGLCLWGDKIRQVKIGNYGIADIICYQRTSDWEDELDRNDKPYLKIKPKLEIQLIELKQNKIDANTLMQCARYKKGIERFILNRRKKDIELDITMILMGREVQDSGDFCYLSRAFEDLMMYTYDYDIDGIQFTHVGNYSLVNENFPVSLSQKRKEEKAKLLDELPF